MGPARRAIAVHSLDHALAAVRAAAELDRPVALITAPAASAYLGPAWLAQVAALAEERFPQARVTAILDCGDRAGDVLAALRYGCRAIRFHGPRATATRLGEIARASGAELITAPLQVLDLAFEHDPAAACRAWLGRRRAVAARR